MFQYFDWASKGIFHILYVNGLIATHNLPEVNQITNIVIIIERMYGRTLQSYLPWPNKLKLTERWISIRIPLPAAKVLFTQTQMPGLFMHLCIAGGLFGDHVFGGDESDGGQDVISGN